MKTQLDMLTKMKLLATSSLLLASVSVLYFEKSAPDANIKTFSDAIWWAFVTIGTVGYGDKYPVTPEGRVIACLLIIVGCATFAAVAGYTASYFMDKEKAKNDRIDTVEELAIQVKALETKLDKLLEK